MNKIREDLVQTAIHRMMDIMRHMRHPGPPPEPFLSHPQAHLLFTIAGKKGAAISVKELAEISHITPGAVTQFMDALVERGMVKREGDPNDRRIVRLKLTEEAKNHFEKMRKQHLESMIQIFEALTNDEIKQLIALFTKMDTYHEMKDNLNVKDNQTS
jgi:DNA-binding MarR family transcriptional regulator